MDKEEAEGREEQGPGKEPWIGVYTKGSGVGRPGSGRVRFDVGDGRMESVTASGVSKDEVEAGIGKHWSISRNGSEQLSVERCPEKAPPTSSPISKTVAAPTPPNTAQDVPRPHPTPLTHKTPTPTYLPMLSPTFQAQMRSDALATTTANLSTQSTPLPKKRSLHRRAPSLPQLLPSIEKTRLEMTAGAPSKLPRWRSAPVTPSSLPPLPAYVVMKWRKERGRDKDEVTIQEFIYAENLCARKDLSVDQITDQMDRIQKHIDVDFSTTAWDAPRMDRAVSSSSHASKSHHPVTTTPTSISTPQTYRKPPPLPRPDTAKLSNSKKHMFYNPRPAGDWITVAPKPSPPSQRHPQHTTPPRHASPRHSKLDDTAALGRPFSGVTAEKMWKWDAAGGPYAGGGGVSAYAVGGRKSAQSAQVGGAEGVAIRETELKKSIDDLDRLIEARMGRLGIGGGRGAGFG
ncbi:hypothetical protein HDV00_010541 [Rhizophlyctis rosea]|nr:hypothetical protein HDV00_010541 [Rhizophlyctis rosea]